MIWYSPNQGQHQRFCWIFFFTQIVFIMHSMSCKKNRLGWNPQICCFKYSPNCLFKASKRTSEQSSHRGYVLLQQRACGLPQYLYITLNSICVPFVIVFLLWRVILCVRIAWGSKEDTAVEMPTSENSTNQKPKFQIKNWNANQRKLYKSSTVEKVNSGKYL